jgi:hypothetical protein
MSKSQFDIISEKLINSIISYGVCPKCKPKYKGTLIGLNTQSVVECDTCHKPFQRIIDESDTYYVELTICLIQNANT